MGEPAPPTPRRPERAYRAKPAVVRRNNRVLLAFNVLPALGALAAIPFAWRWGVRPVELWLFSGLYLVTGIGFECGFHRYLSHAAFKANKAVHVLLSVAGCMAAAGTPITFAATHRHHHAFGDKEGDPHSPHLHGEGLRGRLRGFLHAHLTWIFSPERASLAFYASDLLEDRTLLKIDDLYLLWVALGLVIPPLVGFAVHPSWQGALGGFLWGGPVRIFVQHQTLYAVNSVCHTFGDRTFESGDRSTNNLLLALPTLGGSLHNSHHAFPSTASNWLRWWQVDPLWLFIRALSAAGWVSDVRRPSPSAIEARLRRPQPPAGS